ncbi:MAG: phosphate acyltransferase [Muribaculaceae bacterium]|nr:phosphate acyltransferase [Muribaculaceae bacterium]
MLTSLSQLVEVAAKRGPKRLAVAYGQDAHTLQAVRHAADSGIVTPVIYGDAPTIQSVCEAAGISTEGFEIVDVKGDVECVRAAVADVSTGKADVLMKGLVSTDKYMRGILNKEAGLFPQGGLLSHVSVFEIPGRSKLLCVGDVAVIPQPDFKQKIKITGYLATTARTLGVTTPKIAFMAPSEQVLPQVISSSEASILAKMADRGQLGNIEADGPLSLDVALWPEVAREKGVKGSRVAGEADCLLFPNIESGNVFFKAATHMAGAEVAAIVVGTRVPCVLTSRGDTPLTKLYSIALACLHV